MPIPTARFCALQLACCVLFALMLAGAQANPILQNENRENKTPSPAKPGADYSGMYSFLRDGEFVQVTVEDQARVTGFVSRYGDSESDRGVFVDHFFKLGKLDGNSELAASLRAMRASCRKFLDRVGSRDGRDVVRYANHHDSWASWTFYSALGEMRGTFGVHLARIAAQFRLDIEDQLASILPAEVQDKDDSD